MERGSVEAIYYKTNALPSELAGPGSILIFLLSFSPLLLPLCGGGITVITVSSFVSLP